MEKFLQLDTGDHRPAISESINMLRTVRWSECSTSQDDIGHPLAFTEPSASAESAISQQRFLVESTNLFANRRLNVDPSRAESAVPEEVFICAEQTRTERSTFVAISSANRYTLRSQLGRKRFVSLMCSSPQSVSQSVGHPPTAIPITDPAPSPPQ